MILNLYFCFGDVGKTGISNYCPGGLKRVFDEAIKIALARKDAAARKDKAPKKARACAAL